MFFKKKSPPQKAYDGPPLDPEWVRNKRGKFPRLYHLDTVAEGLGGYSGVYVIWHSGVKPQWVYVGRAGDIGAALDGVFDNDDIMEYEKNGGLYVTWSPIRQERQNGVVKFLTETLKPVVENPAAANIKDGAVNVIPPSRRSELL